MQNITLEDLNDLQLVGYSKRLDLSSAEDINLVAAHMLSQTKRTFYIVARNLDRKIFDQDNISKTLFELARYSRNSDIRILVHDTTDAVRNGHALIELARRLSSYIEVRLLGDDHKRFNEAFIVADKRGYIYQGLANRYDAIAEHHNPRMAQELENTFLELWNQAEADPNFRQLHI